MDGGNNICGYIVCDDVQAECRASEVGGQGREVFSAILAFLARRAVRLRREHLWVNAPDDHPFPIYCRDFGLRLRTLYPRNERPMGRIIDLNACFQAILPELARRWGSDKRNQSLSFHTDIGSVAVAWLGDKLGLTSPDRRAAVHLRQDHLMQLLLGYVKPLDLHGLRRLRTPKNRMELLEQLFPLGHSQLWWADRF